jgi:Ca2+-binding RTX toxin-like protein
MSFVSPPPSDIWDIPGTTSPPEIQTWTGNPDAVDATTAAYQVGGTNQVYTTTDAPDGAIQNIVLSGTNNTLFVGTGDANIQAIGGGNIVESVQVLGDGTKVISTGAFGDCSDYENDTVGVLTIDGTTANFIGESATIDQMAGGMIPQGGFNTYAVGGTGDDKIYGSCENDFLRGGMGSDTIYAYAGDDLVRGGFGSDLVTLGSGKDTLYYTVDQLAADFDTVTDFGVNGETDVLAVDQSRVADISKFGGFGSNTLTIQDSDGSVTTVQAQAGYQWKQADIFFVV